MFLSRTSSDPFCPFRGVPLQTKEGSLLLTSLLDLERTALVGAELAGLDIGLGSPFSISGAIIPSALFSRGAEQIQTHLTCRKMALPTVTGKEY